MTTTKINRRTALLGSVTLPAAMAPLSVVQAADNDAAPVFETYPDPFVSAFCRYEEAECAYLEASKAAEDEGLGWQEREERAGALCDAAADAMLEMAETVPTTTLGLYLGIHALLPVFGELKAGAGRNVFSFDDMVVRGNHTNGSDEALLRSLRTAAERILNGNGEAV